MFHDWYNKETDRGCLVGLYFHDNPCEVKLVEVEFCQDMSGKNELFTHLSYAGKTGSDAAASYFDLTEDEMHLVTWSETLPEAITNLKGLINEEVHIG